MNEMRIGGTPINPTCSDDLKKLKNHKTFTFSEPHSKCMLIIGMGNSTSIDNSPTASSSAEKYEVLYGNVQTYNVYLAGGLLVVYLENVKVGDTVTTQGGTLQTNSCVIDL